MTLDQSIDRLRLFRQSFEDGEICEESGLSTQDVDAILKALEAPVAVVRMKDGLG